MSFSAWHKRTRQTRNSLLELRNEIDAELVGMADTWAEKVIAERRARYEKSFAEATEAAKAAVLSDLAAVIAAKEARFSEAMGSPGLEAVQILSLLNMRNNVSAADIAAVVPKLSGSLLALQSLAEIAERNNVTFPKLPDADSFHRDISDIREFAEQTVNEGISKDNSDLKYLQLLFWTSEPAFMGLIQEKTDKLDSTSYLQIDASDIGEKNIIETDTADHAEKQPDKASEQKMQTRLTLKGSEYLDVICRQFDVTYDALKAANGNRDLSALNPGETIIIPGTLKHPENGNGHVNARDYDLVVEPVTE